MRNTHIGGGGSRPRTRRDRGVIGGEGSLDSCEGHGRLDHPIKNVETAMWLAVARHDQGSLIDLMVHGLIHLRMQTLELLAIGVELLLGVTEVLGS